MTISSRTAADIHTLDRRTRTATTSPAVAGPTTFYSFPSAAAVIPWPTTPLSSQYSQVSTRQIVSSDRYPDEFVVIAPTIILLVLFLFLILLIVATIGYFRFISVLARPTTTAQWRYEQYSMSAIHEFR